MSDRVQIIESAMSKMTSSHPPVYDVTIICTTDDHQAAYWMDRLERGVCQKPATNASKKYPMVLAVSEDWAPSGAGNGLGTLYAFQKACLVALSKYGVDLKVELEGGLISAALFHTAGKGTRLAPLPASENNNKPGVVSELETVMIRTTGFEWMLALDSHMFPNRNYPPVID